MVHSETFGSFIRKSTYPLEADYIFNSEEELQEYCKEHLGILHDGLFKVVKGENKQTLYWCIGTEFYPLILSDSLDNLNKILEDIEVRGKLQDIINKYESKLRAFLQELDLTQVGAGLNADGSFDKLNVQDTRYLANANSIVEALKELDRRISSGGSASYNPGYGIKIEDETISLSEEFLQSLDIYFYDNN